MRAPAQDGTVAGDEFLKDYTVKHPQSATFAACGTSYVKQLLGAKLVLEIADEVVRKYQARRERCAEDINDEVGDVLRVRIPRDADQHSELMSITIPK